MTRGGLASVVSLMLLFGACERLPFGSGGLLTLRLEAVDGIRVDLASVGESTASVFVFLAPDCPLSQNYTLTLNGLRDRFASDSIRFYGVVAGSWFDRAEVAAFVDTYQTRFPILLDEDFVLAGLFGATVTPEVFTVDARGDVVYAGAIDNWAGELGQHRTVITAHYLRDALTRMVLGRPVEIRATEATGCYIERMG